jgi:DNA-binding PadR family transcriptional regulator
MGNKEGRAAFADWHAARHQLRDARQRMRGPRPGFGPGGFGPGGFGPGGGFGGFCRGHGGRMRRGGTPTAIVALLAEQPMHGYQIIQELATRSGGAWTPGAGSVYPALEQLEAQGMITGDQQDDKRVYTITDKGREMAEHHQARGNAPWDDAAEASGPRVALGKSVFALMNAAQQIGRTGSDEQVTKAVDLLDQLRKQLYGILAE